MPSPSARPFVWLLRKEWRELTSSRAWWLMLGLTGPLVGVSFIAAVRQYAEVSAGAGSGCGVVCDPLTGIWAPTFSAFELVAIFVLPFVAIRLVSGDRLSGALRIELQRRLHPIARLGAKLLALIAGWALVMTAAVVALVLWRAYGGRIDASALVVLATGHVLDAGLAVAIAVAAASIAHHPSTAAILTLAVTVGGWILEFVAAIHGGLWDRLAALTPSAMVATFEHGLVQVSTVLVCLSAIAGGLGIAAIWTRLGVPVRRRTLETTALVAVTAGVVFAASNARGSWDASASRQNSFSEPAEEALAHLATPVAIDAHLAPEDPRRLALERGAFAKLRRATTRVTIAYTARTASGFYEQADPGYGEIWYSAGGKRAMGRGVTDEGVLETIFSITGAAPDERDETSYAGAPLVATPAWAPAIFYGLWPAAVAGAGVITARRPS